MKNQWQQLLARLEMIEENEGDTEILTTEQLTIFETENQLILPADYSS